MFTKINDKVKNFQERTNFIGWYYDTNGNYCGIAGQYLICIFVNSDTNDLELTISYSWDIYDCNTIEWITIENSSDEEIHDFIYNFLKNNH